MLAAWPMGNAELRHAHAPVRLAHDRATGRKMIKDFGAKTGHVAVKKLRSARFETEPT